jgi:hypothetical protein
MTTHRDPDRLIRAYLDEGLNQLPDRTYDAVREQIDRTRQRAVLGSMRGPRVLGVPRLALAVAAVVVLAVVGMNLPPTRDGMVGGGPTGLPSSTGTPRPSASATPGPTHYLEIVPGSYSAPWAQGRIRLTMPAGWSSAGAGWEDCPGAPCWPPQAGTTLTRYDLEGPSPTLTLNLAHDVTSVVADVCVEGGQERLVEVGPTVEDLTTALVNQIGVQRSGPMDITLGGYPARKFVLTMPSSELFCPGPEGKRVWANGTTNGFWLLKDGTATIYVVDVNGDRLVVTSLDRGSPVEDIAQLDAIIASIEIQHVGLYPTNDNRSPQGDLPVGRHSLIVEGISFSFDVPTPGWERFGNISLNKSAIGPQGAEGIVYWTGFPDGVLADLCPDLISLPAGASALDLAAAVATAPGTELVSGPLEVTVGGRAALHTVVTIREDVGCDPGFFYTWHDAEVGALWTRTDVGDTVRIWIVDVDGTRLLVAGETNWNFARLDEEIQQIVASIQFE